MRTTYIIITLLIYSEKHGCGQDFFRGEGGGEGAKNKFVFSSNKSMVFFHLKYNICKMKALKELI